MKRSLTAAAVKRARALSEDTTSADVAKRIVLKVRAIKKKKKDGKELPCPGSKILSKGQGQGLGRGGGAGPIGRM